MLRRFACWPPQRRQHIAQRTQTLVDGLRLLQLLTGGAGLLYALRPCTALGQLRAHPRGHHPRAHTQEPLETAPARSTRCNVEVTRAEVEVLLAAACELVRWLLPASVHVTYTEAMECERELNSLDSVDATAAHTCPCQAHL